MDFNSKKIPPTTTVLNYLRSLPNHKGVKEGCAEGDCGACTVVIAEESNNKLTYKSFDSCLIFLPSLHGKQLITVEDVGNSENLHPVQEALVDTHASQCGFCTPGITMSLFSIYKQDFIPSKEFIIDALTGNLCRCTGYKPIIEAAHKCCGEHNHDNFSENENETILKLQEIKKTSDNIAIDTGIQKYYLPTNLKTALQLRTDLPASTIINGGTDVALRVTKKNEIIPTIIDLSQTTGLKQITKTEKEWSIGTGISLEDVRVEVKEIFPALYEMLSVFGSKQIRNKATFGGNIGSASPIGDTTPVLMAYNSVLVLKNTKAEREIKLREFITGYRTTQMNHDELIIAVKIPIPNKTEIIKSYKISKRKDLDISTVSACFNLTKDEKSIVKDIFIVYGGMAATTSRATKTEKFLIGKQWNRENIEKAMKLIDEDFTPISDARSGAEARKIMARNLMMKFYNDTNKS
ncbi:MAG: xanthine dehydrogenase small subunit [Bacteroidetes bacterium GWA2_30_7]|nr:MAG: xanthine dehydrogenase small subunit [Bacteroidetes bacterium GWA2_30_7]